MPDFHYAPCGDVPSFAATNILVFAISEPADDTVRFAIAKGEG